ncbi:hypothetical protein SO694_001060100 [Aureococcus anophagefferens]|uniref:Uncharacterized protein n=1 Tax=Aureococcus anophagefferens TaxID=44056 RepID=A0ABR1FMU2_AURAN
MEDSDDSSAHESDFSVESDDDDIPTDQPRSIEALDGGAVAALAALDDDGLAEQVWDCYDGLALAASGGSAAAAAVAARVRGALSARERVLVVRTAVARCDDGAAGGGSLGGGARRAGASPRRSASGRRGGGEGSPSSVDSASSGSDDSDRGDSDSDAGDRAVVDGDRVSAPATAADLGCSRPRRRWSAGGARASRALDAAGDLPKVWSRAASGRPSGPAPRGSCRVRVPRWRRWRRSGARAALALALLRRAGRCAVARDAALELRCGRRLLRVVAACADEAARAGSAPASVRAPSRRADGGGRRRRLLGAPCPDGARGCVLDALRREACRRARRPAATRRRTAPVARRSAGARAALDRDVGRGYDALHARLDAHLGFLALARAVAAAPALPPRARWRAGLRAARARASGDDAAEPAPPERRGGALGRRRGAGGDGRRARDARARAGQESEIPNFKGSFLAAFSTRFG